MQMVQYRHFITVVIILLALLWLSAQGQEQQRGMKRGEPATRSQIQFTDNRWAVVIGIAKYKNLPADQQLRFSHRDARAFAEHLQSAAGGGFAPERVRLIVDEAATLAALRSSLGTWLARSAEPDDIVYIYFAGHGVVEIDGNRDGYLLPYDADPQDFYATAFSMSELRRIISERLNARAVVLITDACHAGTLGPLRRGGERELLLSRYVKEAGAISKGSMLMILASRENELSYEDSRWNGGHGVFTYCLLKGMKGEADTDRDGVVRASELIGYVAGKVPEETKAAQHPQAAGNFDPNMPMAILSANSPNPAEIKRTRQSHKPDKKSRGESPLAQQTMAEIERGNLVAANGGGAVALYERLSKESPDEPKRYEIETELSRRLEEVGQDVIARYLQGGRFNLTAADFHKAAASYDNLARLNPADRSLKAKRLFCEGRALIFECYYQEAYKLLQQAAGIDAQAAYTHNAIGMALASLGNRESALVSYKTAIRLAPYWSYPRSNAAGVLMSQGDYAEAETELKAAVELSPQDIAAHLGLGNLALARSDYAGAERYYTAALALEPASAVTHANFANLYLEQKRYALAEEAFRRALTLDARNGFARVGLGITLMEAGKLSEAELVLSRAVRYDPRDAMAHNALGTLHLRLQRFDRAEIAFKRAAQLDSCMPEPHYALGELYEAQGRLAAAAQEFELFATLTGSESDAKAARQRAEHNRKWAGKLRD